MYTKIKIYRSIKRVLESQSLENLMDHREAEKQIVTVAEAAAKIDPCHLMDHLVKALVRSAIWISIGKRKTKKFNFVFPLWLERGLASEGAVIEVYRLLRRGTLGSIVPMGEDVQGRSFVHSHRCELVEPRLCFDFPIK